MDFHKKHNNSNPTLTANVFNRIWFIWLFPLFWYGKKHEIEEKDLYNALPQDCSGPLGDKLEKYAVDKEIEKAKTEKRKPNFFNVITKAFFWSSLNGASFLGFAQVILRPSFPTFMACYIEYFEIGSTTTTKTAYLYATLIIASMCLFVLLCQHGFLYLRLVGMQARIACSSLIYKKITKISSSSVGQINQGFVINVLQDDCFRIEEWFTHLQQGWMGPLQLPIVIYLVWRRVGVACAVGIILLLFQTLPVQVYFGKIIFKLRKKASARTDRRILLIKEVISGIRVIKMYIWEKPIGQIVSYARKYEINDLTNIAYLKTMSWAAYALAERITLFITILTYALIEGRITSTMDTYSILQHFNSLQLLFGLYLTRSIISFSETKVAAKRIEEFLLLDEVNQGTESLSNLNDDRSISIHDVTVMWKTNSKVILNNVNIQLNKAKLYVVLGPAGSGKRSFIKLILGELQPSIGKILRQDSVSYSSQERWLFDGTIRSNILFGESYNRYRYMKVIRACCLLSDFTQLPQGDKTILIEGGTILSGGQRARVNLARAVYREADIYILDDPLSAVDINVGKQLMGGCINGLLKDKTRILVTHNLHYLNKEDTVILFNKGSITYQGIFGDIPTDHVHIQDLPTYNALENSSNTEELSAMIASKINAPNELINLVYEKNDSKEDADETTELVEKGKIKKSLFWKYYKSGGSVCTVVIVFISFVITQSVFSCTDYWVSYMTRINENNTNESYNDEDNNATFLEMKTIFNTNINIKSMNLYIYTFMDF